MIDNLEIGKVYYVKTSGCECTHWLFKKDVVSPRTNCRAITSCRYCMCLDNDYINRRGNASHLCIDDDIRDLRIANRNYIVIWNRIFNDNVELV